jgi:hypothetical protein
MYVFVCRSAIAFLSGFVFSTPCGFVTVTELLVSNTEFVGIFLHHLLLRDSQDIHDCLDIEPKIAKLFDDIRHIEWFVINPVLLDSVDDSVEEFFQIRLLILTAP